MSYKQNRFDEHGEKSAYFCPVFSNNFLGAFFKHFFNRFEISVKFSAFFDTLRNFWIKIFFALITNFFKLRMQISTKLLQKNRKSFFYERVLEFN